MHVADVTSERMDLALAQLPQVMPDEGPQIFFAGFGLVPRKQIEGFRNVRVVPGGTGQLHVGCIEELSHSKFMFPCQGPLLLGRLPLLGRFDSHPVGRRQRGLQAGGVPPAPSEEHRYGQHAGRHEGRYGGPAASPFDGSANRTHRTSPDGIAFLKT
ncbi:MAG TPA: hypothetical protein VGH74_09955, partial [Planctomycetaceae bacterium]